MFAVLRLSRRFYVTLGRAQLFWQPVGACDHVTFEMGFSHIIPFFVGGGGAGGGV